MPVIRVSAETYKYITKCAYAHRQSRTQYLEGVIARDRDYQSVKAEWDAIVHEDAITETIHPVEEIIEVRK